MFLSPRINSVCSFGKSIQRFPIAAAISSKNSATSQRSTVIKGLLAFSMSERRIREGRPPFRVAVR
jgi:hypothetical protein